jgi:hypothetical protein
MSNDSPHNFRAEKAPECPHCGASLFPFGAQIKTWGLLEWVEAWHCPIHGPVPEKNEEKKPEPEV